jgi:hypothetical protein
MKTIPAFALGILLVAGGAWADTPIYKWVDAQGVVHYSTEPHSDDAKQIKIINSGNALPGASTAPLPTTAAAPASATDDAALVIPTQNDSDACKQGRERLFQYLHADTLYQLDAKGDKQALSKDQQAQAVTQARNYVRQACTPGGR